MLHAATPGDSMRTLTLIATTVPRLRCWLGAGAVSVAILLSGCQSTSPIATPGAQLSDSVTVLRPDAAAQLLDEALARSVLYAQYQEWRAVRYRIGGLSKSGVDCSGFVYLTFRDRFGIALPRSTHEQAVLGRPIDENELRTGDLVFFRTERNSRHVGIFLEDRKFLHASTRKGVMISSLDDFYWSKEYWRAVSLKS
jgi:cell wall-associated NlpC family hydrolase